MKKETNYSFSSNLLFILQTMQQSHFASVFIMIFKVPFLVGIPFLTIYLSSQTVRVVTENQEPQKVILVIAILSTLLLFSKLLGKFLSAFTFKFINNYDLAIMTKISCKCLKMDYEISESPEGLTRISKAMEHLGEKTKQAPERLSDLLSNIIGISTYAAFLISLNLWVFIAVTLTTFLGFYVLKIASKWRYNNKDNWKTYDRKLEYLRTKSGDFTYAKDIRLYSMSGWFYEVFNNTLNGRNAWHKKEQWVIWGVDVLQSLLSLIREGVAYLLLVYTIYANDMSAADFVLYFGLIGGLTNWLNATITNFNALYSIHMGFTEIRELLDYPNQTNQNIGEALPFDTFEIKFSNVSFAHIGNKEAIDSKDYVIKNLNFTINKGEKLAIVGLNGAGKTTLVKLMCGLYDPTEGNIYINGTPMGSYNRNELYNLFSVVFQDIFVMPVSIALNISSLTEENTDLNRVEKVLKLAGLYEKAQRLPSGIHTRLVKGVYEDAIDLSGGEMQKLALARALYKESYALILDEPTAALDPIAESYVYQEYSNMTKGHTSVFISHRLASTSFCDRIIFLEKGEIAEYGSHEELMSLKSKYYEMYNIQSKYYK